MAPRSAYERRREPGGRREIGLIVCCLSIAIFPLRGAVEMQVREGIPVVNGVYLNGHGPYRFILDTGTNVNLMEASLARSIGLTATCQTELTSSAGVRMAGCGEVDVRLDSIHAERQPVVFVKLDAFRERWPDIQGVLGQAFLSRMDYLLDLRARRLEFGKQDFAGTRTEFRTVNGRLAISTSLGALILDSGAERVVLFGVEPDTAATERGELRTVTGVRSIGMAFSKPLNIDGRKIWRGDAVAIPQRAEPGVEGLLPLRLFKAIYVCNSEGYLVFQ